MKLVKVSSCKEGFNEFLYGQTMPLVEEEEDPFDWAYYWDYENFLRKPSERFWD